jgi:hypothetical protein
MKKNNLLASVALFSELYNSETFKSIPDILAEFIKGAVVFEKKFSLNSTELKELLQKTYGFIIPESVLRTTLKNRLKDIVTKEFENFHFDVSLLQDYQDFKSNVETIDVKQNDIVSELYDYIETKKEIELTQIEKNKVFENFSHFLMDNGYSDKYSELISAFVISKETDVTFKEELSAIKEGLILYQGINYSADINQLGSWKDKLTIYLSTEHLFNCLGYNGVLFKEIFEDFSNLVNEINRSHNKQGNNKLIELKYLDETYEEIDHFFKSAESIKKGYKRLDPSKLAMSNILKGCEDVSDIKEKQVNFFLELKRNGINHQEYSFDIEKSQFNVVDENVIEDLKTVSEEKKMPFNEEYCTICLRLFTKINTFRQGRNNVPFEKIGHIYITENGFAKYLGHNNTVKFEEYDIAFAKDIDYVISKFWFKLKKGFNDKASLPKTFDLVTKAKIIMSSHINNSLSDNYDKLQSKFKKGEFTEEVAIELSHAYKEKPNSPELITSENIDDSLQFLDDENFIEDFLREKTRKEVEFTETLQEKEALEKELQKYKQKELEAERKALQEKEEKELNEKREKYQIETKAFNTRLNSYIHEQWNKEYKTRKWHLWKYLIFILSAILIIFLLIGFRDYILTSLGIEITETSKLYYSAIVAVVGFIATTIRSFFDTKNILFAVKLIVVKAHRNRYKKECIIAFNKSFLLANKEPILE